MPHHIFVPDDIVDVLPAETDQIGEPIASGLDTNPVVVYASRQPLVPRATNFKTTQSRSVPLNIFT